MMNPKRRDLNIRVAEGLGYVPIQRTLPRKEYSLRGDGETLNLWSWDANGDVMDHVPNFSPTTNANQAWEWAQRFGYVRVEQESSTHVRASIYYPESGLRIATSEVVCIGSDPRDIALALTLAGLDAYSKERVQ